MMTRQDYVSAEIFGLTGLKLSDIQKVKIDKPVVVEFGQFKDVTEFNIKYLIAQGIKADYIRLESGRNLKKFQNEKHISVFQVIEKNGKLIKNYECFYLPERKNEVVKPENVSVPPTNINNDRKRIPLFGGKKEEPKTETVSRAEFDDLKNDIKSIMQFIGNNK